MPLIYNNNHNISVVRDYAVLHHIKTTFKTVHLCYDREEHKIENQNKVITCYFLSYLLGRGNNIYNTSNF